MVKLRCIEPNQELSSEAISVVKAVGILLMVLGHAGCPKGMEYYLYMFHMPLFFMISGYCFKEKYLLEPKTFVWRRVKGLYVPYVKYALLFLVFHNVFYELNIYNGEYGRYGVVSELYSCEDYWRRVRNILINMGSYEQLLNGYWFLKQLLLGSVISLFAVKYIKGVWRPIGVMLVLTIVCSIWPVLHVPFFNIGALTFFSAMFFLVGRAIRRYNVSLTKWAVVAALLIVLVGSLYCPVGMHNFDAVTALPFTVCAIAGTLAVMRLSTAYCRLCKTQPNFMGGGILLIIRYIGNNTLAILTWHLISFRLTSLLIIQICDLPIAILAEHPVIYSQAPYFWPLYFLIGTVVPLLIGWLENKLTKLVNEKIIARLRKPADE